MPLTFNEINLQVLALIPEKNKIILGLQEKTCMC